MRLVFDKCIIISFLFKLFSYTYVAIGSNSTYLGFIGKFAWLLACKCFIEVYLHPCFKDFFFFSGKAIVAGYSTGAVNVFNVKTEQRLQMEARTQHECDVNAIDVDNESKMIVTGSVDGLIKLTKLPDLKDSSKIGKVTL